MGRSRIGAQEQTLGQEQREGKCRGIPRFLRGGRDPMLGGFRTTLWEPSGSLPTTLPRTAVSRNVGWVRVGESGAELEEGPP